MANAGLDQWQNGYPNRSVWEQDIADGAAFVALDGDEVIGMYRYGNIPEEAYESLGDAWQAYAPYATIHRCAVDINRRGEGIIGKLMNHACNLAINDGATSMRIDTHPDNTPMRRAIEKAGFELRGIITLPSGADAGSKRVAFEKVLSEIRS